MSQEILLILERLEGKLDKQQEHIHEIDKTLVRNTASLEEHMKRTEMNEEAIELLREELKPVRTHVNHIEGGIKLIGLVSLILGVVAAIVAFLN